MKTQVWVVRDFRFCFILFLTQCFYSFLGNAKGYKVVIAAYWLTGAYDGCRVGFLPSKYDRHRKQLDGRLVQVIDVLAESSCIRRHIKVAENDGVCLAMIADRYIPGDEALFQPFLDGKYDMDSSADEGSSSNEMDN